MMNPSDDHSRFAFLEKSTHAETTGFRCLYGVVVFVGALKLLKNLIAHDFFKAFVGLLAGECMFGDRY